MGAGKACLVPRRRIGLHVTRLLDALAFLIVLAPLTAGLYGWLIGWLLARSRGVAIGFGVAFCLSNVWLWFALIPTQGWVQSDFAFYLPWMIVIFVPAPLVAGILAGASFAYARRAGYSGRRFPLLFFPLAGGVAFGGAGLLSAAVAARMLANAPMNAPPPALDPFVVAFYGPLLMGAALFGLFLRVERIGRPR